MCVLDASACFPKFKDFFTHSLIYYLILLFELSLKY